MELQGGCNDSPPPPITLLTPRVSKDLGTEDTWLEYKEKSYHSSPTYEAIEKKQNIKLANAKMLKRKSGIIAKFNPFSKLEAKPESKTELKESRSESTSPTNINLAKSDSLITLNRSSAPTLATFQKAKSEESGLGLSPITPRTPRMKQQSSHKGINEIIIQHKINVWKEVKAGSPRNKIISKFELGKLIGKGASGSRIYECRLEDGGMFAVKRFDLAFMTETDIKNVEKEREIMEQIPYHKNLTIYRGHYDTDTEMYIFMNLYNDNLYKYLRDCLANNKFLSVKEIVKMSIDILTGLSILHECDIIHRDLKSLNIFVNYGSDLNINYLTIGDFDTAKKILSLDGTKTCVGTPLWIAPEVLNYGNEGSGKYCFKADIWSFGMILYEMMTCQLPFNDQKGTLGYLFKIVNGVLPSLTDEQIERYSVIMNIWKSCLDLNPDNRPTADSLLNEFESIYLSL